MPGINLSDQIQQLNRFLIVYNALTVS